MNLEPGVKNFRVFFGHEDGSACTHRTMFILRAKTTEEINGLDISKLNNPLLNSCVYCDAPLTRVAQVIEIKS